MIELEKGRSLEVEVGEERITFTTLARGNDGTLRVSEHLSIPASVKTELLAALDGRVD